MSVLALYLFISMQSRDLTRNHALSAPGDRANLLSPPRGHGDGSLPSRSTGKRRQRMKKTLKTTSWLHRRDEVLAREGRKGPTSGNEPWERAISRVVSIWTRRKTGSTAWRKRMIMRRIFTRTMRVVTNTVGS